MLIILHMPAYNDGLYRFNFDTGGNADTFVPPIAPPVIMHHCERCGVLAKSEELRFARVHNFNCESGE